jgi:hypothetical protein
MTTSQDHHGHSTNLRVHIPTTWRSMMEQLIQSDQWPEYNSIQSIVRDSLYHRLRWTGTQKNRPQYPAIQQAMIRERYRKRLDSDIQHEAEMRDFRKMIDRSLSEMLQREEYDAVQSYCEDILADMDSFTGDEQSNLINQIHTYMERAKGRW